jgi:hypothetical protein
MSQNSDICEHLSAYLDGELTSAEAREVEAAARQQPQVARDLRELRATRELLRSLDWQRTGEGFGDRVLAEAERRRLLPAAEAGAPVGQASWPGRLAAAAVLLVAAGVGFLVFANVWHAPPGRPVAQGSGRAPVLLAVADDAGREGSAATLADEIHVVRRAKTARDEAPGTGARARKESRGRPLLEKGGRTDGPADWAEVAAHLAKPLGADAFLRSQTDAGKRLALAHLDRRGIAAEQVVLEVRDLREAQRQVEGVLASNRMHPANRAAGRPAPAGAPTQPHAQQQVAGLYQAVRRPPREVNIVVCALPQQLTEVARGLNLLPNEEQLERFRRGPFAPAARSAPAGPRRTPAPAPKPARKDAPSTQPGRKYSIARITRRPLGAATAPSQPTTAATAPAHRHQVLLITLRAIGAPPLAPDLPASRRARPKTP